MIRDYTDADAAAVLALNAANVPEVGPLDPAKLTAFARMSPFLKVVVVDGDLVGMLIGLTEDAAAYASPNYRWFRERYPEFGYVDRIALDVSARGQGHGPALYRAFEDWTADQGKPVLCAEVNTQPPNPRSQRFHQRFGFVEVARCRPYQPEEEVAMLVKTLAGSRDG